MTGELGRIWLRVEGDKVAAQCETCGGALSFETTTLDRVVHAMTDHQRYGCGDSSTP